MSFVLSLLVRAHVRLLVRLPTPWLYETASSFALDGLVRGRRSEVHGPATPALAMADFNDEPFDLSLVQYALSTRQQAKVVGGTSPRLWNLMWDILGRSEGSFFLRTSPTPSTSSWSNKNMARQTSPIQAMPGSVDILRFQGMVSTGTYPAPVTFGGMGKPVPVN